MDKSNKPDLTVSDKLLECQECSGCDYAEDVAEIPWKVYCVPAGKIVPKPIPGWCPLMPALLMKLAEKSPGADEPKPPGQMEWHDSFDGDRLSSSYMSAGFRIPGGFSMVVQQSDQRPGAPYREGQWMVSSDVMGLMRHRLEATTGEAAKAEAIQLARGKLREALFGIRDVIVTIEQEFTDDPDTFGMYDGALAPIF